MVLRWGSTILDQNATMLRMMRRILLAATGVLIAGAALAGESGLGRNVEGLLDYARAHSPEYAAMRLEAAAAAERVEPAGALPDPVLRTELQNITNYDMATGSEGNVNLLPGRVGSTKYTLMQTLPFWGKRDLKREVARAEAESAQSRVQAAWSELAARIKTAFAEYFYTVEAARLVRQMLDLVEGLEKTAQARYANGLVPQQDVIRAQVERSRLKVELIAQEAERRRVEARINGLLARPADAPLAEPESLRPLPPAVRLDPAALNDRLLGRNPDLAAEEARLRAASSQKELVWRNRYPDFTLGVSPIQTRNRVNEWEVMVEFNLPLQQASRRSQEREAQTMIEAARARREALASQALAALARELAGLEAARRTESLLAGTLLPQAELTFQSAIAAYENGRVDFATLLDAQREIRRVRQERLKAQLDAQMRLAEIERLLGEEL